MQFSSNTNGEVTLIKIVETRILWSVKKVRQDIKRWTKKRLRKKLLNSTIKTQLESNLYRIKSVNK